MPAAGLQAGRAGRFSFDGDLWSGTSRTSSHDKVSEDLDQRATSDRARYSYVLGDRLPSGVVFSEASLWVEVMVERE
jgi:hypothetical protein